MQTETNITNRIIRTAFKQPSLIHKIPYEVLDDLQARIVHVFKRQQGILNETPSLSSIAQEIARDTQGLDPKAFKAILKEIASYEPTDRQTAMMDIFELNGLAQQKIIQILAQMSPKDKDYSRLRKRLDSLASTKGDVLEEPMDITEYKRLERLEETQIWSLISWLDENDVPIKKKVLYSLIATTNGGKTIIKTWFAVKMMKAGCNILFLAQEEPKEDFTRRCHQICLGLTEAQYKEQTKDGFEEVGERFNKLVAENNWGRIMIVNWFGSKISEVQEWIHNYNRSAEKPLDGLFIDYAKLMGTEDKKSQAEWERIGKIFSELKALAMQENVFIFTSIQLNRESTLKLTSENRTPQLEDVAGAFEATHHVNYAWAVQLDYSEIDMTKPEEPNTEKGVYKLTVLKQKYGRLRKGHSQKFVWTADHNLTQWTEPTPEYGMAEFFGVGSETN